MALPTSDLVILIIAVFFAALLSFVIGYAIGRRGDAESEGRSGRTNYAPRSSSQQQVYALKEQIDGLDALNNRYLNFMLNVPAVVKKLNSSMKFQDITAAIVRLVSDIISTRKVELYIHQSGDQCLKKVVCPKRTNHRSSAPWEKGSSAGPPRVSWS
jgi:hypothetical protein